MRPLDDKKMPGHIFPTQATSRLMLWMTPRFLKRALRLGLTASISCLAVSLFACGNANHIPPINKHPQQRIQLKVAFDGPEKYGLLRADVLYASKWDGCSYKDYMAAIGGVTKRPEAWVAIASRDNSHVAIYEDRFEKKGDCPLAVDQVILRVIDGSERIASLHVLKEEIVRNAQITARCRLLPDGNGYDCFNQGEFGFAQAGGKSGFIIHTEILK